MGERWRIGSIPRRTAVTVLRERGRVAIQIGGGSLLGSARRVSRVATAEESDWSRIVAEQNVFHRPSVRKKARPELLYESDGRIDLKTDVIENYDDKGNLGITLEIAGIEFTKAFFRRSRHDRPERATNLFLDTRGDIFDIQIADQMDVQPFFFQQELYLPQLTTTHDPGSMYASQNNGIVTVGYNPRAY